MKRMPLLLAVLITAFTLGVIGTVVKVVSASQETARVAELQQEILDQKLAYAQIITDANSRIIQANDVIKEISSKKQSAEQDLAASKNLSVDEAISLALTAVGLSGSSISGHAELVDYNGLVAYEVQLDGGAKVYLDAVDGKILYNSLTGGPSAVIDDKKALFEAVTYMQGGQVVSVEKTVYNETPAYLVTFTSGDQVYISLSGEVLALVQPQYFYTASVDDTDYSSNQSSEDHEDEREDEHEEEHEEEHEDESDD